MVSWPVALTGQSRLTPSPSRRPYAACLHITPFPAVACFPLPKACACRARTCWGFLRPVPAFSGPLPRHSPFPFVVKTIYTYANFTSIKISYMYMLNQKIPPTPRRLGGHAHGEGRGGTKRPMGKFIEYFLSFLFLFCCWGLFWCFYLVVTVDF